MMKSSFLFVVAAAAAALTALPAGADQRYGERPPVVVSPELTAPWVMQLGRKPGRKAVERSGLRDPHDERHAAVGRGAGLADNSVPAAAGMRRTLMRTAASARRKKQIQPRMDPIYLPQQVDYTVQKAGHDRHRFGLEIPLSGPARRQGAALWCRRRQEGMTWKGTRDDHAQAGMAGTGARRGDDRARARQGPRPAGRTWKAPGNPLGARAMYLGSTLYRIHGTNAPWTIGTNVSSGCIRLRNEDVVDLYERVERRHQGRRHVMQPGGPTGGRFPTGGARAARATALPSRIAGNRLPTAC